MTTDNKTIHKLSTKSQSDERFGLLSSENIRGFKKEKVLELSDLKNNISKNIFQLFLDTKKVHGDISSI